MRSGVPQLAIALPLPHRRPSLLSLNSVSAASPHTPRSSGYFDACPPPVCYATINKRNSTDSWTSSNAAEDMMDLDWKPEQLLLLTRTLDALPAHLVTPFNGPIPPSNLLDKIARGVAHAKGPLDWPHSIRATRAKLLDLARTRAKEDALAEKRRHIVIREEDDAVQIVQDDDDDGHDLHDGADKPLRGVGIGPRRPLYRQSSMDFIKPGAGDLKDNQNIARLSNRLQRTDRTFPNPSFHPYARSARSKPQSQRQDENRRSSSPPHSSDVPSLMMMSPSTPSSTTLNSDTHSLSLSSYALRPRNVLRRSASTMSSSSLFTTSSTGSGGGGGGNGTGDRAMDRRLQRVRRSDSFSYASSAGPPPTPAKDYAYAVQTSGSLVGIKRAPSYGALRQGKKGTTPTKETPTKEKQAPVLPQTPPRKTKELAKETPTQQTQTPKHTRQISAGSCASSDEEEKVRTRRAKKMRSSGVPKTANTHTTNAAAHSANTDAIMHSPAPSVPPSPSVGAPSAPGSPMGMGTTTLMGGPIPGGILSWGRAGRMGVDGQLQLPMESPKRRVKPYLYERERGTKESGREKVVEGGREREREREKVVEGGKERKEREAGTPKERVRREKERKNKEERHSSSAPVASTITMVSTSAIATAMAPATATASTTTTASANVPTASTTAPTATAAAATTTVPPKARAPRMSAQRNPSMFGAELPVLKPSTTTGSVGGLALGPALPTIPSSASRETTGREPLRERSALAARSPRQMQTQIQTQTQVLMARAPVLMQSLVSHSNAQSSSNAHSSVNARSPTASAPTATTTATGASTSRHRKTASSSTIPPDPMDVDPTMSPGANTDKEKRVKTLRRVRRLPGARRISFGMGEGEEVGVGSGGLGAALGTGAGNVGGQTGLGESFAGSPGGAGKRGLGSAFQMS